MKYIEIVAGPGSADTFKAIADKVKALDFRLGVVNDDGMQSMRLLVDDKRVQKALDAVQGVLGSQPNAHIVVLPVEAVLPPPDTAEEKPSEKATPTARELLYENLSKGARLDADYLLLVFLSTVVAGIGLLEDNVAVVIGAMVIAPLLSPNLAFSLGTTLGDPALTRKSALTLLTGIGLALLLSVVLGLFWNAGLDSAELLARTDAGLDSVALALASGAAAALSLTSGLSSVLVGVMVAVALLPPAATLGIMLGAGNVNAAVGAALLLAINIVCVNLSSKIVFHIRGISPRTWPEKEKARTSKALYILAWLISLVILVLASYARRTLD
jgi:uncharacterized hydrophobic protein (TIGR00341 family)